MPEVSKLKCTSAGKAFPNTRLVQSFGHTLHERNAVELLFQDSKRKLS